MKTIFITGGSRGIGRAMVKLFSEKGYRVGFTYNNSIESARELEQTTGAKAYRVNCEIPEEIKLAVDGFSSEFGGVDVLVNNVGMSAFSMFCDISLDDWNKMLSVNLTSAFLFSKAVLPYMISQKWGRIINISSMWGVSGASCEVHYSASKAALIGMTGALAKELGPSGITVNAIAPGFIDTDMNSMISDEDKAAFCEQTPVPRMGTPEEVAAAAVFLADESSGFITGEVLNVSGGYVN